MARRRRKWVTRGLIRLGALAAAGLWLWSQPSGRTVLLWLGAAAVALLLGWIAATRIRRRRWRLRRETLEGLLALTPREFEDEVAGLLESLGFREVTVSGAAGDLQADIVATDPDGLATVVQCKRYAPGRSVGSPVVQSFVGMARLQHGCDRALLVTTATFTAPAQRLADEHDVELVDGPALVDLFAGRIPAGTW
jgi:restriction system protein